MRMNLCLESACLLVCVAGRKLSEERGGAEDRAAEVEKKLTELVARINAMIHVDVTDALATFSAEQTVNAVSRSVLCC